MKKHYIHNQMLELLRVALCIGLCLWEGRNFAQGEAKTNANVVVEAKSLLCKAIQDTNSMKIWVKSEHYYFRVYKWRDCRGWDLKL